jgi:hypothetical protein
VAAQMKIYIDDGGALQDLREWMTGHSGIVVKAVARPSEPTAQGSVWDFLSILCASAGPLTVAMRALQLWIESRTTVVQIVIGAKKFTVRTTDAATVLPQVMEAATRILESAEGDHDGPA